MGILHIDFFPRGGRIEEVNSVLLLFTSSVGWLIPRSTNTASFSSSSFGSCTYPSLLKTLARLSTDGNFLHNQRGKCNINVFISLKELYYWWKRVNDTDKIIRKQFCSQDSKTCNYREPVHTGLPSQICFKVRYLDFSLVHYYQ